MTNEVGIKEKFGDVHEASRLMVKKYTSLLALGVEPIIWFTPGGKKDNNGGALVDETGNLVAETKNSYEAINRFLGQPCQSCQDLSTEQMTRFRFAYRDGNVDVMWPNEVGASAAITVDEDCRAYSYQNQQLSGRSTAPTAAPLFVVSGTTNPSREDSMAQLSSLASISVPRLAKTHGTLSSAQQAQILLNFAKLTRNSASVSGYRRRRKK